MASKYKSQKEEPDQKTRQVMDILLLGMRQRPYTMMDVEDAPFGYSIENIHAAVRELKDTKLVSQYDGMNVAHGGTHLFMLTERGYKKAAKISERERKNNNPLVRRLIAKVLLEKVPDLSGEFDEDTLTEMFGDKLFRKSLIEGIEAQHA